MNDLSWLIYLIGLFDTIKTVGALFIIFGIMGYIMYFIASSIHNSDSYNSEKHQIRKYPVFILTFILLVVIFTPNRVTMLLIAASEIGEKLMTNEKVINTIDPSLELLQTWIKKETLEQLDQLKNLKNEK